ncbi:hypothetical protein F8M41_013711 [Gigaspora margarita]|uniref:Uncharacterized protein n=1 Tax=Gigaspora margarita TaxID=4874 RepID=A0A8H4A078_GIGMA|nr:hypothetical protein F8M41_013711 [Gigaspora margarita]
MNIIGEDSFGGIYIDIKANKLIVNIKDPFLKNSTLLDPYRDLLLFNIVNKSLNELKVQFDQDVRDANISDSYIYIDVEVNNVIIRPNSPSGLNMQPFGPKEHASMRPRQQRIRTSKKRAPGHIPTKYIITTRSCNFKDSKHSNSLYLINWGTFNLLIKELKILGIMEPNYTIPYDFLVIRITKLFITDARPAIIHGGHICHFGFGTHVTCGNIKALTAIYLNKDNSSSKDLIITDMNTRNEDIGSTVFFYKSPELHYVDLCGIQVTLGPNIAAVLPSNIILEIANLVLHKL